MATRKYLKDKRIDLPSEKGSNAGLLSRKPTEHTIVGKSTKRLTQQFAVQRFADGGR